MFSKKNWCGGKALLRRRRIGIKKKWINSNHIKKNWWENRSEDIDNVRF